jgi:hypothetical protein
MKNKSKMASPRGGGTGMNVISQRSGSINIIDPNGYVS